MDKKELRKFMKKKRSSISIDRILIYSAEITGRIMKMREYEEADVILAYVSFSSEVDTHMLINDAIKAGKRIAVPKVEGDIMNFYYVNDFSELKPGAYGILEPEPTNPVEFKESAKYLLLLPGVAFDDDFNRLGYGGGYYDKFTASHDDFNLFTVMPAYELERVSDGVPYEAHDTKPDCIVTELNIYYRSR